MKNYYPIWATVHWTLVIVAVGAVLRLNASNFDATEVHSIIQIAIAVFGLGVGKTFLMHKAAKNSAASKPKRQETGGGSSGDTSFPPW